MNETISSTPPTALQPPVTVREILRDAQTLLAEAKLNLSRARNQTEAQHAHAVIGRLCQACEIGISTIHTLRSGGGGAL